MSVWDNAMEIFFDRFADPETLGLMQPKWKIDPFVLLMQKVIDDDIGNEIARLPLAAQDDMRAMSFNVLFYQGVIPAKAPA